MKKLIWGAVCIIILGIGYWLISPLWTTVEVNEPAPISGQDVMDKKKMMRSDTAEMETVSGNVYANPKPEIRVRAEVKATSSVKALTADPVIIKSVTGDFVNGAHEVSGVAKVLLVDNKKVLRFENFNTVNGPDLFIYLATDNSASDYVNLGAIKATKGNVNYDIQSSTDLGKYKHVLVWCKSFGVLFGSATLR